MNELTIIPNYKEKNLILPFSFRLEKNGVIKNPDKPAAAYVNYLYNKKNEHYKSIIGKFIKFLQHSPTVFITHKENMYEEFYKFKRKIDPKYSNRRLLYKDSPISIDFIKVLMLINDKVKRFITIKKEFLEGEKNSKDQYMLIIKYYEINESIINYLSFISNLPRYKSYKLILIRIADILKSYFQKERTNNCNSFNDYLDKQSARLLGLDLSKEVNRMNKKYFQKVQEYRCET